MLYSSTSKCFSTLLKKNGYSRTYQKNNLWKYHYIFTHMLERTVLRGENRFATIRIKDLDSKLGRLRSTTGKVNRASKIILDELVKWDVLIRAYDHQKKPSSVPGGKDICTTRVDYKINDSALVNGFSEWIAPADVQPSPIAETLDFKPLTGIYQQLLANLSLLDFDAAGARNYAKNALNNKKALWDKRVDNVLYTGRYVNKRVYSAWVNSIDKLEKRIWNASSDEQKTKRFFTTLHSCPADIRDFVTINGQNTDEVDVSSCQCVMLAILLKRHFGEVLPPDVAQYISLCEQGTFYAYVQALVGAQAMQYSAFKQEFFGRIFYSSEKKKYKWRALFADPERGFPTVSAFITLQKTGADEHAYKQFPVALSALESEIMLEGVAARLLAEGVTDFYTIHDAFYCTPAVRERVKQVLREEFAKHGVRVHVKEKLHETAPVAAFAPVADVTPAIPAPPAWLLAMDEPQAAAHFLDALEQVVEEVEEVEEEPIPTPTYDDFPAHLLAQLETHFAGVDEQEQIEETVVKQEEGVAELDQLDDEQRLDWMLAKLESHEAESLELDWY